jgi:hypothetical protein
MCYCESLSWLSVAAHMIRLRRHNSCHFQFNFSRTQVRPTSFELSALALDLTSIRQVLVVYVSVKRRSLFNPYSVQCSAPRIQHTTSLLAVNPASNPQSCRLGQLITGYTCISSLSSIYRGSKLPPTSLSSLSARSSVFQKRYSRGSTTVSPVAFHGV